MTESSPTPKGVTVSRGVLIGGGAVLLALLVGVAVLVGIMAHSSWRGEGNQAHSARRVGQPDADHPQFRCG